MGLRKGVYVGFWCPPDLKLALQEGATIEHRTLSQECIHILDAAVKARSQAATNPAQQAEEKATEEATS